MEYAFTFLGNLLQLTPNETDVHEIITVYKAIIAEKDKLVHILLGALSVAGSVIAYLWNRDQQRNQDLIKKLWEENQRFKER